MARGSLLREAWEVIPVAILILGGGLIAIRSGIERPVSGTFVRHIAGNFSLMVFRLMGYAAALATLQYWIGAHALLGWP